jgi:hypothetical protein
MIIYADEVKQHASEPQMGNCFLLPLLSREGIAQDRRAPYIYAKSLITDITVHVLALADGEARTRSADCSLSEREDQGRGAEE